MKRSSIFLVIPLIIFTWAGCKSTQNEVSPTSRPARSARPAPDQAIYDRVAEEQRAADEQPLTDEQVKPVPLPVDGRVRIGKLDNGLTYYLRQNEKPQNIAEMRLVVNVGSMQENEDQQGLAHFLEHMAFNGTENFPKQTLIDFLESNGQRFGAHLNAYTSFDETVYMLRVPTDTAGVLETGLQILEDWAHNVSLKEDAIDGERGVVIEEWRTGLGANERMRKKTMPEMFYGSRYKDRLPIGKKDILEDFSYETLRSFYDDWYRPELMSVVVVGDIDTDKVEEMIRENFSRIEKNEAAPKRVFYPVPDHPTTRIAVATDPEATYNLIRVMYKHPIDTMRTEQDLRESLKVRLATQMLNARMAELTRQENPPFTIAGSGYSGMVRTKANFSAYALVPGGGFERGLEAMLNEMERASRYGFTESELERAKSEMLTESRNAVQEADKTESSRLVWEYVGNYLRGTPMLAETAELAFMQEFLPEITLAEVNARFDELLTDGENRVVTAQGPEQQGAAIPTEASLRAVIDGIDPEQLEPYVDEVIRAPLMEASPMENAPDEQNRWEEIDTWEWVYPNGARVIIKPTDFKNDQILFRAFSPGGTSLYSDEDFHSASYADAIVSRSGLGDYDPNQLEKYLSDKNVSVSPYIGEEKEGLRGSSTLEDQEIMFQMIHQYFESPRRDRTAYEALMSQQRSLMANMLSRPQSYFQKEVLDALYQNNLRRQYPTVEVLDKVDFERANEIFTERFDGVRDFTFLFVGNIDPEEFKPLVDSYIGALPAGDEAESAKDVGVRRRSGNYTGEVRRGTEPQSSVQLMYHGDFEWTLENRTQIGAMQEVLSIMLREQMREAESGVYGVRVSASTEDFPEPTYVIQVSWQCAPENVDRLIEVVHEQIAKLQAEGPTAEKLQKVVQTRRESYDEALERNENWLSWLSFYLENDIDPTEVTNVPDRISNITAESIQESAKKYLDGENYFQYVLYPVEE